MPDAHATPGRPDLPIDDALPQIVAAVTAHGCLVLTAETGAGKTTRVPPALLDSIKGRVLMLQPRRVAARAAARRVADENGWRLGHEVGYQVRFERKISAATRIEILTEGILTRRLQADPFLDGVGAVILDEFHERSLHGDLALALLADVRASARPNLHLIVMSATLDAAPLTRFLGDAPWIDVPGRSHPVTITYAATSPSLRDRPGRFHGVMGQRSHAERLGRGLAERVEVSVRATIHDEPAGGDILVFLPGVAEIARAEGVLTRARRRGDLPDNLDVLRLHGSLPLEAQERALQPGDHRRVILATNVAETSLTLPGVTTVIDSGLVRQLRHDPARGLDHLKTVRCSVASTEQRAGRAGRLGPGRALRLWSEAEQRDRPAQDTPEIRRVDLARVVLEVRTWGGDPACFGWFDPPTAAGLTVAEKLLVDLRALRPGDHTVTPRGHAMLALPLHPRLAAVLLAAHDPDPDPSPDADPDTAAPPLRHRSPAALSRKACALVALLAERDILVRNSRDGRAPRAHDDHQGSSDLLTRLALLHEAEAARFDPDRLTGLGVHAGAARQVCRVRDDLLRHVQRVPHAGPTVTSATKTSATKTSATRGEAPRDVGAEARDDNILRRAILAGFPDRVARRRGPGSPRAILMGGRGVTLAPESVVRNATLFIALVVDDRGVEGRVRLASAIEETWLDIQTVLVHRWDEGDARVIARRQRRVGDLVIDEHPETPDPDEAATLLAHHAALNLARALPKVAIAPLRARVATLRRWHPELALPALGDDALGELLPTLCVGKTRLADLQKEDLGAWLEGLLSPVQRRALAIEAPTHVTVPSGQSIALNYNSDGAPPILAVKLQELFGLQDTPRVVGGRVPVLLHLLAPNGRPVQVTQDLQSFWRRTYAEVRKDLRRRYPKHPWPDDPLAAAPTHKTQRQLARDAKGAGSNGV